MPGSQSDSVAGSSRSSRPSHLSHHSAPLLRLQHGVQPAQQWVLLAGERMSQAHRKGRCIGNGQRDVCNNVCAAAQSPQHQGELHGPLATACLESLRRHAAHWHEFGHNYGPRSEHKKQPHHPASPLATPARSGLHLTAAYPWLSASTPFSEGHNKGTIEAGTEFPLSASPC